MPRRWISKSFFVGLNARDHEKGIVGQVSEEDKQYFNNLLNGTVTSPYISLSDITEWNQESMQPEKFAFAFLRLFRNCTRKNDILVIPIEAWTQMNHIVLEHRNRYFDKWTNDFVENRGYNKRYIVSLICKNQHFYWMVFDSVQNTLFWGDTLNLDIGPLDEFKPFIQEVIFWRITYNQPYAATTKYVKVRCPEQVGLTCAPLACACLISIFKSPIPSFESISDFMGDKGWQIHRILLICIAKNTLNVPIFSHRTKPNQEEIQEMINAEPINTVIQMNIENQPIEMENAIEIYQSPLLTLDNFFSRKTMDISQRKKVPHPSTEKLCNVRLSVPLDTMSLFDALLVSMAVIPSLDKGTLKCTKDNIFIFLQKNSYNASYEELEAMIISLKIIYTDIARKIPRNLRMAVQKGNNWCLTTIGTSYLKTRNLCTWNGVRQYQGRKRKTIQDKVVIQGLLTMGEAPPSNPLDGRKLMWISTVKTILKQQIRPLSIQEIIAGFNEVPELLSGVTPDRMNAPTLAHLKSMVRQGLAQGMKVKQRKPEPKIYVISAVPDSRYPRAKNRAQRKDIEHYGVSEMKIYENQLAQNATENVQWKDIIPHRRPPFSRLYVSVNSQCKLFSITFDIVLDAFFTCSERLYAGTVLQLPLENDTSILSNVPRGENSPMTYQQFENEVFLTFMRTVEAGEAFLFPVIV